MSRIGSFLGALVFLALAAVSLYRLLFYFPITVGGHASARRRASSPSRLLPR